MANKVISNVVGPPGEGSFCERYLDVAGDLAGVGKWFLIVALLLGVAAVVIKAILDLRKPAAQLETRDDAGGVAATLVTALKGLIDSLSAAPTWLAIFVAGLAILWGAGHALPDVCKPFADDKPVCKAGDKACASKGAGGNFSTGNNVQQPSSPDAPRDGDGSPRRDGDGLPSQEANSTAK